MIRPPLLHTNGHSFDGSTSALCEADKNHWYFITVVSAYRGVSHFSAASTFMHGFKAGAFTCSVNIDTTMKKNFATFSKILMRSKVQYTVFDAYALSRTVTGRTTLPFSKIKTCIITKQVHLSTSLSTILLFMFCLCCCTQFAPCLHIYFLIFLHTFCTRLPGCVTAVWPQWSTGNRDTIVLRCLRRSGKSRLTEVPLINVPEDEQK